MRYLPAIGTKIYASVVRNGMIIQTESGERVEVEERTEGYNTWTFGTGTGRNVTVEYGERVELLGYFNPEKVETS